MRKKFVFITLGFIIIISLFQYYQYRRKSLWVFENKRDYYPVLYHEDDTIRIAMIGDSWAALHSQNMMDNLFQSILSDQTNLPVKMLSKGKGGEKSRGIYQLMFENNKEGTKTIFAQGLDYCILSAGINDVAANLGPKLFCYHMRLILDFLLYNRIRPIILEIPDVNIWKVYNNKPIKDLVSDYIRSLMSHCRMYQIKEYRDSLYSMLLNENYMNSIIYIRMNEWNGTTPNINKQLFLNDQIHLNKKGYELLDSCIIIAIANDLKLKPPRGITKVDTIN